MKKILILTFLITIVSFFAPKTEAQEFKDTKFRAKVTEISKEQCEENTNCTKFSMEVIDGERNGEIIESTIANIENVDPQNKYLKVGDRVIVQEFQIVNDFQFVILGPVRELPILLLTVLFVILILAIARFQGLGSLTGLGISIFALFGITTPMVLNGQSPILAGYLGAIIVLLTSIFLSHGINRKSLIALASSFVGLIIISILTWIFIDLARLSGFGADDAINLLSESRNVLDMRGILFASIIVGGIGVLDDITINQVSAMEQIYKADPKQNWKELFSKSMQLGKDHIASLVNTLFIAYASASMPLVMVLQATNSNFFDIVNSDQFAEEIVRAIIGSMGLILVVPISSLIGAYIITKKKESKNIILK